MDNALVFTSSYVEEEFGPTKFVIGSPFVPRVGTPERDGPDIVIIIKRTSLVGLRHPWGWGRRADLLCHANEKPTLAVKGRARAPCLAALASPM